MKKIGTMIYVIAVVIAQYVSLKDFTNHLIFMLLYFKGFGAFFYPCCYLGCLAQDAGESCSGESGDTEAIHGHDGFPPLLSH